MFYTTEIDPSQCLSLSIFSCKTSKFLVIVPNFPRKAFFIMVCLLWSVQEDHLTQVFPDGRHVPAVGKPPVESSRDDLLLHGVAKTFDWN